MQIKEVEKKTGLSQANIRFYEKEGLIHPKREANNYRTYSGDDIKRLEEIKKLRLLGVSIQDIKLLLAGEKELLQVAEYRLVELEGERNQLELTKRMWNEIAIRKLEVSELPGLEFDKTKREWEIRLDIVMKEDLAQVTYSPREFNIELTKLLVWGYLLCTLTAFVFCRVYDNISVVDPVIKWVSKDTSVGTSSYLLYASILLLVGIGLVSQWTSSAALQIVVFHLSAIINAVYVGALMGKLSLWIFAGMCIYIAVFGVIISIRAKMQEKHFHALICWGAYTIIMAVLVLALAEEFSLRQNITAIALMAFLSIIATLEWMFTNKDSKTFTKYTAYRTATTVMNVVSFTISRAGYNSQWNLRR